MVDLNSFTSFLRHSTLVLPTGEGIVVSSGLNVGSPSSNKIKVAPLTTVAVKVLEYEGGCGSRIDGSTYRGTTNVPYRGEDGPPPPYGVR